MKKRRRSIAATLFWLTAAWLIVALAATALLLSALYGRALDDSLSESLEFNLNTLAVTALTATGADASKAGTLDPRFSRTGSGWYWQIQDQNGVVQAYSNSAIGSVLPDPGQPVGHSDIVRVVRHDDFGNRMRMIGRRIISGGKSYSIVVTGNLDDVDILVSNFRGQALTVLGAVGLMLAIMSAIVARFALRPIGRLRRAVERVREGESEKVKGTFPREIEPLADEVNELLRSNSQIIERARSQVGNLAHGLKTPLAVLRNDAAGGRSELARSVSVQTDRMADLVATYLDRARLAARTSVVGRRADVAVTLRRLTRVLAKLYPDRTIDLVLPEDQRLWFRGEEGDLEEIVGNLTDNACKWARKSVRISVTEQRVERTRLVAISVEDDGPGLSDAEAGTVMQRGVRLDEKTPGSGLGLDIVKELVDVYGGSMALSHAKESGLRIELVLPAVRA